METTLLGRLRHRLATDAVSRPKPKDIIRALADDNQAPPDHAGLRDLAESVAPDLTGAGRLQAFLDDPDVTDVVVNGPRRVWVDRGNGLEQTSTVFGSSDELRELAVRLAAAAGRRLDSACPYVDVRLEDGTRLHAILPPLASNGPYVSLRTHRQRAFRLDELVENDTIDPDAHQLLRRIVSARLAFLITGGTGTGKTTLMNSMLSLVPPRERIIVVEDSRELAPTHPHVLSLQSRLTNVEGRGRVDLAALVRQALRMRPDRIIVGECRGVEVTELLSALNTGHEGGAGTLHCNTAADVPARLEALALPGGVPRPGLHAQIASALRVIVHLGRHGSGRRVEQISLIQRRESELEVTDAYAFGRRRPAWTQLQRMLRERDA
ncbi:TadA family conjugal transfer-associated ATPase [Salininema proteolyticum]|uniref:TadA family conjugal transfer-associated ATPase n=1 Tax=Salininema proteolyticum TaxID=1607685 RepID=A0ABV8TXE8_9ACTN